MKTSAKINQHKLLVVFFFMASEKHRRSCWIIFLLLRSARFNCSFHQLQSHSLDCTLCANWIASCEAVNCKARKKVAVGAWSQFMSSLFYHLTAVQCNLDNVARKAWMVWQCRCCQFLILSILCFIVKNTLTFRCFKWCAQRSCILAKKCFSIHAGPLGVAYFYRQHFIVHFILRTAAARSCSRAVMQSPPFSCKSATAQRCFCCAMIFFSPFTFRLINAMASTAKWFNHQG